MVAQLMHVKLTQGEAAIFAGHADWRSYYLQDPADLVDMAPEDAKRAQDDANASVISDDYRSFSAPAGAMWVNDVASHVEDMLIDPTLHSAAERRSARSLVRKLRAITPEANDAH